MVSRVGVLQELDWAVASGTLQQRLALFRPFFAYSLQSFLFVSAFLIYRYRPSVMSYDELVISKQCIASRRAKGEEDSDKEGGARGKPQYHLHQIMIPKLLGDN